VLALLNWVTQEEIEVASASAASLAGRDGREAARFGESERSTGRKPVTNRAAERRVFSACRKEMNVIFNESGGPFFPAGSAGRIGMAVELCPPQAVVMEGVGIVVIDGFVHAINEPAVAEGHRFKGVEEETGNGVVRTTAKAFLIEERQGHDIEEHVVIAMKASSANAPEPVGDLGAFGFRKRIPE
jgi:hypothetical protein